mgnify:FL=1
MLTRKILNAHGFPVPTPLDQTRHTVLMSYEDAYPLRQIAALPIDQVRHLYSALMALIVRLARAGLIHGDFNEFNLLVKEIRDDEDNTEENDMIPKHQRIERADQSDAENESDFSAEDAIVEHGKGFARVVQGPPRANDDEEKKDAVDVPKTYSDEDGDEDEDEDEDISDISVDTQQVIDLGEGIRVEPVLIDFPQMVSIEHPNAAYFFERDVDCVRRFFRKRFRFESEEYPTYSQVMEAMRDEKVDRLDALTRASGFGKSSDADAILEMHLASMHIAESEAENSGVEWDEGRSDGDRTHDEDDGQVEEEDEEEEESDEDDVDDEADVTVDSVGGMGAIKKGKMESIRRKHDMQPGQVDMSYVSSRTAASRAQAQRRSFKHHGRKSQATKIGRRHGGGKAKHNKARIVADSQVI